MRFYRNEKLRLRLSGKEKEDIARDLINAFDVDKPLSEEAALFIMHWIRTAHEQKTKAYYDVWELVLKDYVPTTRPVLYRACSRRTDGKIASFTSSFDCAERFSSGRSFLLVCDTNHALGAIGYEYSKARRSAFYPIYELLCKEAKYPDTRFTQRFLEEYTKEEEYIMRVDLEIMYTLKWYNAGKHPYSVAPYPWPTM